MAEGTDPTIGRRPFVIGLTGNIACGKSTVAGILATFGAEVIDADRVARQVMAPPGPVYQAVVREFGTAILAPDGSIDRRKLGQIVFSDPAALRRLDALVHPETVAAIRRIIAASSARVVVVEAVKLIEAGLHHVCDALWIATCRKDQQIERLVRQRHLTRAEAIQRVAAQEPVETKLALADVVIDTSGTVEDTRRQVEEAWGRLGLARA